MRRDCPTSDFIGLLSQEAVCSLAVHHPYLQALSSGTLPNMKLAFRDFAEQYGIYSKGFTHYLTAVKNTLECPAHRALIDENLSEELGNAHDVELPPEVLTSIINQPHSALFKRFQVAVGAEPTHCEGDGSPGNIWRQEFLELCRHDPCVGIGALGIGTELIVHKIYVQIVEALTRHSSLTDTERVFFDLHAECDEEHAEQMAIIARELASSEAAQSKIRSGVERALHLRVNFWETMMQRALAMQHEPIHNKETAPVV